MSVVVVVRLPYDVLQTVTLAPLSLPLPTDACPSPVGPCLHDLLPLVMAKAPVLCVSEAASLWGSGTGQSSREEALQLHWAIDDWTPPLDPPTPTDASTSGGPNPRVLQHQGSSLGHSGSVGVSGMGSGKGLQDRLRHSLSSTLRAHGPLSDPDTAHLLLLAPFPPHSLDAITPPTLIPPHTPLAEVWGGRREGGGGVLRLRLVHRCELDVALQVAQALNLPQARAHKDTHIQSLIKIG